MFSFAEGAVTSVIPDIRVFGVGGAGGHIIESIQSDNHPFRFFTVDSTPKNTQAETILLGDENNPRSLGAGSNIEVGRNAALSNLSKLKEALSGAEMLLLIAGLGGGIGSGALPVVVRTANELSIPVLTFVMEPFPFERGRRSTNSEICLRELRDLDTALVSFSNTRMLTTLGPNTRFVDAMAKSSEMVSNMITRFLSLFTCAGLINIDFSDLRTFLNGGGKMFFGDSKASNTRTMEVAVSDALNNPLISEHPISLSEANQVLAYLEVGSEFNLGELHLFGEHLETLSSADAIVILGITVIPDWTDELRVTIMAKGFNSQRREEILKYSDVIQFVRRA